MEIEDRFVQLGGLRFHYREAGDPGAHVPQDLIADAAARIPDCGLVTLGGGHRVHRERRDAFVAAVRSFLG